MSPELDWWGIPLQRSNPNAPIGQRQRRLLAYLATHSEQTFKISELAKALNMYASQAYAGSQGLVTRGLAEVTTPPRSVRRIRVTRKGIAHHQAPTDAPAPTTPL